MTRIEYVRQQSGGFWTFKLESLMHFYALLWCVGIAWLFSSLLPKSFAQMLTVILTYHLCGSIIRYSFGYIFYKQSFWFHISFIVLLGSTSATFLCVWLARHNPVQHIIENWQLALQSTMYGAFFLLLTGGDFYRRTQKMKAEKQLLQEQKQNLQYEKDLTEVELKGLQSQIEPHFLFNTLANIHALFDDQPEVAKRLLGQFTELLRPSLSRSRAASTNLGMELDILDKYLSIQQQRLGERLYYEINYSDELREFEIPPMLVQPLVENAIVHGIEPTIDGGQLVIEVDELGDEIRIAIRDTGMGFSDQTQGHGIGINNVRSRLKAIYGEHAKLSIKENAGGGVESAISIRRDLNE